jgi:sodium transport system permease protein
MSWKLLTVFRKEWRDTLRDMRSLRMLLLMPVYLVGVYTATSFFLIHASLSSRATTNDPIYLSVSGAEELPGLIRWLEEKGIEIQPVDGDVYKKVETTELAYVLIIPADASEKYAAGEAVNLSLVFDATNTKVQGSLDFVRKQIRSWNKIIGNLRLMTRGIDPTLVDPVSLSDINIASDQKMGFFVMATVPFFLLMASFLGSVGFSADMLAGERERRSLESLLITPVSSHQLLIGKWLNAFCLTLLVIFSNIVLLLIAFQIIPFKEIGMKVDVGLEKLLTIFLVVIPVAVFATCLQFLISIYARSFKDAQTYMGLMVFIPMIPLVYTLSNPSSFYEWFMWVPVLSHQIAIKNILIGQWVDATTLCIGALVSLSAGALLLAMTARQLRKPKIVYGI